MASSHSTATEHATGNATEHALGLDAVAIDRADTSIDNLVVTLFRFLTYILQDPFCTPGFMHATEQLEIDCIDIVHEPMAKSDEHGCLRYTEQQLLVHKKVWNVVTRDKEGRDKEHFFSDWCRRVASHSNADRHPSTATEHATEDIEKSIYFR